MADESFDVLIIGAGPAGLAAAWAACQAGARVAVVDDNPDAGGQIWRGERGRASSKEASLWFERIRELNLAFFPGTQIVAQPARGQLLAESAGVALTLHYKKLILATGARERFLPFPGWTLPGVMGAGGLQALAKTGLPVAGKHIIVAGSGPLLLPVAAYLGKHGGIVPLIAEQTPWAKLARFAGSLLLHQRSKIGQALGLRRSLRGIPYRAGCWPVCAEGTDTLEAVVLSNGKKRWTERCDYLACSFGLVPNLELPELLGCKINGGIVEVDCRQRTSIADVYCAGEPTGVGGVDKAVAEGVLAGQAATQTLPHSEARLKYMRGAHQRFCRTLEQTFTLRPELRALADDQTIVCRCEDVTLGRLRAWRGWRDAKLQTRTGMGPCQGRICRPALEFLFGWEVSSTRPPIFPVGLGILGQQVGSRMKNQ